MKLEDQFKELIQAGYDEAGVRLAAQYVTTKSENLAKKFAFKIIKEKVIEEEGKITPIEEVFYRDQIEKNFYLFKSDIENGF